MKRLAALMVLVLTELDVVTVICKDVVAIKELSKNFVGTFASKKYNLGLKSPFSGNLGAKL